WLLRTLTISRSNRTVVLTVSCVDTRRVPATAMATATDIAMTSARRAIALLLRGRHDVECDAERVQLVAPTDLRPCAIASGLRHQPLERDVGTAAQLLEIGARRNHERRRSAVVVWFREDVERMRVDVLRHVFA